MTETIPQGCQLWGVETRPSPHEREEQSGEICLRKESCTEAWGMHFYSESANLKR